MADNVILYKPIIGFYHNCQSNDFNYKMFKIVMDIIWIQLQ